MPWKISLWCHHVCVFRMSDTVEFVGRMPAVSSFVPPHGCLQTPSADHWSHRVLLGGLSKWVYGQIQFWSTVLKLNIFLSNELRLFNILTCLVNHLQKMHNFPKLFNYRTSVRININDSADKMHVWDTSTIGKKKIILMFNICLKHQGS